MTARGEIHARTVVIAAGSWSSLLRCDEAQRFEVEPARGQMAALEMPSPAARHVIYSRRGYLVPRLGGYLIAGSTTERAGYDKRVTAGGMASVINNAIEIMPCVADRPSSKPGRITPARRTICRYSAPIRASKV